jgi:hypothetical protein
MKIGFVGLGIMGQPMAKNLFIGLDLPGQAPTQIRTLCEWRSTQSCEGCLRTIPRLRLSQKILAFLGAN